MKFSKYQGNLCLFLFASLIIGTSLPAIGSIASQNSPHQVRETGNLLLAQLKRFKFNRLRVKAPSNRIAISGAVRGTDSCKINKNQDILALLPPSLSNTTSKTADSSQPQTQQLENVELTTAAHPNIVLYLPENSPETATFGLREFDKKGEIIPQRIYYVNVKLPSTKGKDGIVVLNIADLAQKDNVPELKVGKPYIWNVRFCENSRDGEITGLIRRVNPNVPLARQLDRDSLPPDVDGNAIITRELAKVKRSERPLIYLKNGIWYSAVSSLAELLRSDSKNPILQTTWEGLLTSEDTSNLKAVAGKTIIGSARIDGKFEVRK